MQNQRSTGTIDKQAYPLNFQLRFGTERALRVGCALLAIVIGLSVLIETLADIPRKPMLKRKPIHLYPKT